MERVAVSLMLLRQKKAGRSLESGVWSLESGPLHGTRNAGEVGGVMAQDAIITLPAARSAPRHHRPLLWTPAIPTLLANQRPPTRPTAERVGGHTALEGYVHPGPKFLGKTPLQVPKNCSPHKVPTSLGKYPRCTGMGRSKGNCIEISPSPLAKNSSKNHSLFIERI